MANENFADELKKVFSGSSVVTEKTALKIYSSDMCPRNLLKNPEPCAAAVKPNSDEYERQISELVSLSVKYGQKIIVRGGGSGVCGAAVPRYPLNTVIIDATGLDRIYEIDTLDGYVLTGPGIMGLRLERAVNNYGFTLGHSPASLSISTPGGWIATRSSGQFSSRYGTIEDLVLGIEVITPGGKILWVEREELKSFLRMEGTTGIITRIKMRIFPLLKYRKFYTFSFMNLKSAIRAMKRLSDEIPRFEGGGVFINAIRLYDFFDYEFVAKPWKTDDDFNKKKKNYWLEKILVKWPLITNSFNSLVSFFPNPAAESVMIVVTESNNEDELESMGAKLEFICYSEFGLEEDGKIAETWYKNRFKLSYEKLEERFKHGIIVDTFDCRPKDFESALVVYDSVKKMVRNLAVVSAHFGIDKEGPYIYFTFAATAKNLEERLKLYNEIWGKIIFACAASGGLTTHHHGVGILKSGKQNDLVPYAYGRDWHENIALPAKEKFDPDNIFNPGNLV